jgi:hypothetical protein
MPSRIVPVFGETDPEPERTFVVKACPVWVVEVDVVVPVVVTPLIVLFVSTSPVTPTSI